MHTTTVLLFSNIKCNTLYTTIILLCNMHSTTVIWATTEQAGTFAYKTVTLSTLGFIRSACAAADRSHGHGLMLAKLGCGWAESVVGDLCDI